MHKMFCLFLVHEGKDHCVRITLPIICGHLSLSQWPISYMVATPTHGQNVKRHLSKP